MSVDSAAMRADFEKVKKTASSAAADIQKAFAAIGSALPGISAGVVAKEIFSLADAAAKVGASIYRMGQITGIGARELSGLRVTTKETGEDFEGLSTTLARAGKNITAAFIDPTGQQGKLLAALFSKIEIESLKLAPVGERLATVTRRVFGLSDAQEQNFAASAIFGRGWMQNVETLKRLAEEGFDPSIKKAEVFNQLVGEDGALRAHEFEHAWNDVTLILQGVRQEIGSLFIPSLLELSGALEPMLRQVERFDEFKKNKGVIKLDVIGEVKEPTGAELAAGLPDWAAKLKGIPKIATRLSDLMAPPDKEAERRLKAINKELQDIADRVLLFNSGPVEKGLTKLREMGAGPEQLARGRELLVSLTQLEAQKATFAEINKSREEYGRLIVQLRPDVDALDKAERDYLETMVKIGRIMPQIDVSYAEQLAAQKHQLEVLGAIREEGARVMESFAIPKEITPNLPGTILGHPAAEFEKAKVDMDILKGKARELGHEMSSAFTQMIIFGRGFGDSLKSLLTLFGEFILKTMVFKSIAESLSGIGGFWGVIGSFFGGLAGKQSGGPVSKNRPYVVGEKGPEIFVPGVRGSVRNLLTVLRGKQALGSPSADTPHIVGEKGPELFVPRKSGTIIPNFQLAAHDFRGPVGRVFAGQASKGLVGSAFRTRSESATARAQNILGTLRGGVMGSLGGAKGKQSGGPVFGGEPYLVGERGPELFIPDVGGTIVPRSQTDARTTIQIDARGADAAVEYRIMRALARMQKDTVARSVMATHEAALRG